MIESKIYNFQSKNLFLFSTNYAIIINTHIEIEDVVDMSIEKKVIQCKKYPITYTLVIKQVKNINMRISPIGEVVVSANPFIPMEKIDDFVSSKISWIIEHQK